MSGNEADAPPQHNARGGAKTAYERLADDLRSQVMSGALKVGDRLPRDSELAASYHVSRLTAREALRSLASHGLVVTRRGRGGGAFVARPSAADVSSSFSDGLALLADASRLNLPQIHEVRHMLEAPAAFLAAQRRTESDLRELRSLLLDPDPVDAQVAYRVNLAFHESIIRAAHNPLLEVVADSVFGVISQRFSRELAPPDLHGRVVAAHQELLHHIEAGDSAAAEKAARNHLADTSGSYAQMDRSAQGPSDAHCGFSA